jgi:hypothetical protein
MATPARAADEKATREAQGRFVEGIARVKAGDFEGARMSFAQAYTVLHKADILWNLALAEDKSGHLVDALAHFKQLARDGATEADRAKANKHVDQLMAETGHIEVAAPPGAQVMVDGEAAGVAPLSGPLDVAPGRHHLELRPVQGEAKVADTAAFAGQTARVSFLVAEPGAPVTTAAAASSPGAATEVQGAQGAPPDSPPAPPPSPDQVQAVHGVSTSRIVTVAALGGAGIASIFLGVYFGLASQSNANDVKGYQAANGSSACAHITPQNSQLCTTWNDAVNAQNKDAALSDGFYVAGGLLAAGAVATWFLWPKSSTSASATIVPVVGPGGAGLTAVGSF